MTEMGLEPTISGLEIHYGLGAKSEILSIVAPHWK